LLKGDGGQNLEASSSKAHTCWRVDLDRGVEAMAGLMRMRRKRLAAEDMNAQKRRDDMLRHQYEQVCESYRAIDDFRGKLLALWPILGGAAGGVALLAARTTNTSNLWAVGLLGFFVSVGVAMYEWNQTLRCDQLKKVARQLERDMHLEIAQFRTLPPGFKPGVKTPPLPVMKEIVDRQDKQEQGREWEPPGRRPTWWRYPVSVGVASSIVYGAVILGWMALVVWGLVSPPRSEVPVP
jgi:hypothetical protein